MKTTDPNHDHANALTINSFSPTLPAVETSKLLLNNNLQKATPAKTHAEKLQTAIESFHFSMFAAYKMFLIKDAQNSWEPLSAGPFYR